MAAVGFSLALNQRLRLWLWMCGVVIVLYNPLLPVRVKEKGVWVILNFATIVQLWIGNQKFSASTATISPPA